MLGQDPRFRFASGGQCARGFRFGVGACLRCLGGTRFFGKRLGRGGFRRLVGPSLLDKLLRCFRFRFRASRRLARQFRFPLGPRLRGHCQLAAPGFAALRRFGGFLLCRNTLPVGILHVVRGRRLVRAFDPLRLGRGRLFRKFAPLALSLHQSGQQLAQSTLPIFRHGMQRACPRLTRPPDSPKVE
ncbi:MAG: hypothetical protein IPN05_12255 [Sulfuritalea sp.]|nr:hypothetical protein [Sulfuritalea sp.]